MPNYRSSKSNRFIRKKKKEQNLTSTPIKKVRQNVQERNVDSKLRLNKFISHSGFCSRRDADEFIKNGDVFVNGKRVTEMGLQVNKSDEVVVKGQKISLENFVYIILHKPKNIITTTNDEKDRKTVMSLVEDATGQRVYPVGRLDRNTTGILLMTNDGDLAHRLMHPSYHIKKTYELQTARPMTEEELTKIKDGVELDDGLAKAYNLKYSADHPNTILLTIHEGRNRQIRRMAEALKHEVIKLKRIQYAGLTLKGIRSGRWRNLRQKEVNVLRKLVKLEPLDFGKNPTTSNYDEY